MSKRFISPLIFSSILFSSLNAFAQSAPAHYVWMDERTFEPYSRTAAAITGPISLSGIAEWESPGSEMTITFGNGKTAKLTSVITAWRKWDYLEDSNRTAEVFSIDADPGVLEQGNTLCGKGSEATYFVFYEDHVFEESVLNLTVYESNEVPFDVNSEGLCAVYSFYSKE